jgi:hypothetical protein
VDWNGFSAAVTPATPGSRFRLFHMPAAFGGDPVDVDQDNDPPVEMLEGSPFTSDDDRRLQVSLGNYNPFFDFQLRNDPGAVGYYKLQSQYLLLDNKATTFSVGLDALTPAGLEAEGIAAGPTILSPNLSVYHEIDNETAIQAFVGQRTHARAGWYDSVPRRNVLCGLAVQSALLGTAQDGSGGTLYWFVEALGKYHMDDSGQSRLPGYVQVVPGLHWRMADNCWMCGGFLVPMGAVRPDGRLWQLTCRWQF